MTVTKSPVNEGYPRIENRLDLIYSYGLNP